MKAFSYCAGCGHGLQPSTIAEIKANHQVCPGCGDAWTANRTLADACEELEQRLARLERVLTPQAIKSGAAR